ncbi:MAG TPA: putative metal-dependent hydrolase [Pyrinomonadaceae bacterium]|nr:putative metal-dependent hydrolase [Pyrinomonadaceae bacterium]
MSTAVSEVDPRFPIGNFDKSMIDPARRAEYIQTYSQLPEKLAAAVAGLTDEQLDTPYRDGGWTLRQTVHHMAESHMNGFIRIKFALTEDGPTIMPYDEASWANLPDTSMPIEPSIKILDGIHARMTELLRGLTDAQFERTYVNPESGPWTVDAFIALYAWHSRHHTAHITSTRERNGW